MTRAFVVVNPAAGGGRTRRVWPRLREVLLRSGFDFECRDTSGRGSATELTARALRAGARFVVAVGGDGTVNEVANGFMAVDARGATLGIIPTGRGRDVCRNVGVARDPELAARRVVEGQDVSIDLGCVQWHGGERRYFVNVFSVGFDAAVARRAEAVRGSGTAPYLRAVLATLHRYEPARVVVSLDGEVIARGPVTAVVVANGAHYGGGMRISPAADPTDGRLDVVVVGNLGRLELLRWLPTLYRGTHLANPKVRAASGRELGLVVAPYTPAQLDGECLSGAPDRVVAAPHALRLRR